MRAKAKKSGDRQQGEKALVQQREGRKINKMRFENENVNASWEGSKEKKRKGDSEVFEGNVS